MKPITSSAESIPRRNRASQDLCERKRRPICRKSCTLDLDKPLLCVRKAPYSSNKRSNALALAVGTGGITLLLRRCRRRKNNVAGAEFRQRANFLRETRNFSATPSSTSCSEIRRRSSHWLNTETMRSLNQPYLNV